MSAVFTEDAYRKMLERETVIEELVRSEGWQALVEVANKMIEGQKERLFSGNIKTHEDYLKASWHLRGIEDLLSLPAQIGSLTDKYRELMAQHQTEPE